MQNQLEVPLDDIRACFLLSFDRSCLVATFEQTLSVFDKESGFDGNLGTYIRN